MGLRIIAEQYALSIVSGLLGKLASYMREQCVALDSATPAMGSWRTLLDGLRSEFEVAIYNLNYDTIANTCWPNAFTGFDAAGAFDARSFHERDWQGLMHLHGSVHFSLRESLGEEIVWREDLREKFYDSDAGQSADEKSDGRELPRTALIAGGFKLDQLLVEPFNSYQSALVRDAYAADAILLGGYGFSDTHVNRALRNALVCRHSKRPPVLVLDWAINEREPVAFRQDRWAHILAQTLYSPAALFSAPNASAVWSVQELKAKRACEVSSKNRTAIWYNGFLEASSEWKRLAGWLAGGSDHLLLAENSC